MDDQQQLIELVRQLERQFAEINRRLKALERKVQELERRQSGVPASARSG